MDFSSYKQVDSVYDAVKRIEVQGATNVALATIYAMELAEKSGNSHENIIMTGKRISTARENEPMARNAVRYIESCLQESKTSISTLIQNYKEMITYSKAKIAQEGIEELRHFKVILTHCHSSTSTAILIGVGQKNKHVKVISTETRPLFQGRLTSKELFDAGVDVTMIVDSSAASFIVDDRYLPVEVVLIGTDELLADGKVINKVGSYQMALAAKNGKDKFYVATSLLKLDPFRKTEDPVIEMRDASEVWNEAPQGLKIINPSFEYIPSDLVTKYITEGGVITAKQIIPTAKKLYPWMFS